MNDGLRRVLGKKSLYLSMLRKFVAGQKFVTANIFRELENNHWDEAMRLAHTLKGVSGNIGAVNLQKLAEQLELAIKEKMPREQIDGRLDMLIEPLENLIAQLEQKLPALPAAPSVAFRHAELQSVYVRLESLLLDDDSEATEVWESNSNMFNTAFPAEYHKIDDCIRSFNFEAALIALRNAHGMTV
jgi:two-component system sensor histidine kinase/response regulator